jgi:DNA-binding transcriptional LysR family regulator
MDFDWLTTFLEVSRQKSFSKAGKKLQLTQPSISAQIRSLESFLGHRLLNRGGGKVTLTAAGRVFQPFAEQSLAQLRHIQLTLADSERMPRGTLTISANDSTSLYVLPLLISRFKKQYPRVSLSIVRAERSKTLELVLEREVDFGIVSLPLKDPRLHVEVIHQDKLILVVPPGHPLAELKKATLPELSRHGFLLPNKGRRREALDALFEHHKVPIRIVMELDSSELLKRLILAGLGIGFLPRSNVLAELQQGTLLTVEVEGMNTSRDLGLISRRDAVMTRASSALFSFATGQAQPAPARDTHRADAKAEEERAQPGG